MDRSRWIRYADLRTNRAPVLRSVLTGTGATGATGAGTVTRGRRTIVMPGSNVGHGLTGTGFACLPVLYNVTTPFHCDTAAETFIVLVPGMTGAKMRPTAPGNSAVPMNTNCTNVGRVDMPVTRSNNRFWKSMMRHPVVRPTLRLMTFRPNVSRTNRIIASMLADVTWANANAMIVSNVDNVAIIDSGLPWLRVRMVAADAVLPCLRVAIESPSRFPFRGIAKRSTHAIANGMPTGNVEFIDVFP